MLRDLVPMIVVFVSFVQLVLVMITIHYTRRHFTLERTASYIERFNSEHMVNSRAAIEEFCRGEALDDVDIERLYADTDLLTCLKAFANFFQEVGVAYKHGMIDRASAFDYFAFLVPHYWAKFKRWVAHARRTTECPGLYEEFERMAENLERMRVR